jgi:ATP-dependent Lon protease
MATAVALDFRLPSVLPTSLPVLPLRKGVLLPGGVQLFTVGRPRSKAAVEAAGEKLILVTAQRDPVEDAYPADLLPTATIARILDLERPGGHLSVLVQGLARVDLTGFPRSKPFLEATFARVLEVWPRGVEGEATIDLVRDAALRLGRVTGNSERMELLFRQLHDPELIVDGLASAMDGDDPWKREILTTKAPLLRAKKVLERLEHQIAVRDAQRVIHERMSSEAQDTQRQVLLRRQLKAIQQELGDDGAAEDELGRLKDKLTAAQLPEEVRSVVDRELRRLERMQGQSPERGVTIDWLGWISELPWRITSSVDVRLTALEAALDRSHHGLGDVKRQVVEHLAVRKLAGTGRADVLLLVGPPGVGKTSIGQAIADATGRKLVRVALGGVRDEAELRGHRRTYIGSRPGRIVEGLRRAGTADAVMLLDEIDKLGQGWQGDPGAALLEILDPEQNHAFTDHYLEVPFDLSKVLFIATANDLSTIPGPLRDRMEVIDISGYTPAEKRTIARDHLLERLARNAGVETTDVEITDAALTEAIEGWTRESGVRQLQRTLGRIFRAAAVLRAKEELNPPLRVDVDNLTTYLGKRRIQPDRHEGVDRAGVATGLAWTPVGGDVLYVEASLTPGNGQLVLTGQLGDVMKESARAALTYVLANHEKLGIAEDAAKGRDIHLHVPAGGVPKDGPSAGVTMFTALASLLSGRAVRGEVAMTGEATLRGRVLPVGGIKSKVLAAHRQGLRTVLLPRKNEADLDDVPAEVRAALTIVLVDSMADVLAAALEPVTA